MIRRSFLKMLGLAPVAAPALAQAAVESSLGETVAGAEKEFFWRNSPNTLPPVPPTWAVGELKSKKEGLAALLLDREAWIADQTGKVLRQSKTLKLSPDLKGMKSFSRSALARMQARRIAERRFEEQLRSYHDLIGSLNHMLEQAGIKL